MENLNTITMTGETRKERLERAKHEMKAIKAYIPNLSENDKLVAEDMSSLIVGYLRLTNYKGYRHYNDFLNEAYDISNPQGRRTTMERVISEIMSDGDVDMVDLMDEDIIGTERFCRMYAEMCDLVKKKGFGSNSINVESKKEHSLMRTIKEQMVDQDIGYMDEVQVDVLDVANKKMLKLEGRRNNFTRSLRRFPRFILKATSVNEHLGKLLFFIRQLLLMPVIITVTIVVQVIIATIGIKAVAKSIWS